jgi:excinuclease ABC subunit A
MRDAGTTSKGNLRAIDYFSRKEKCPACNESELNHDIKMIQGRSLAEALQLPLPELLLFVQGLSPSLDEREWKNSHAVIEEIELRLVYLNKIGLKAL